MSPKVFRYGLPCVLAAAVIVLPIATASAGPAAPAEAATSADSHQHAPAQPFPGDPAAYQFGATLTTLSGRSLEITFLAEIIPHHQAAIDMAKFELQRGVDPDIRTHADNIIADQQHQISQFTGWLKAWYGLTPSQAAAQAPAAARAQMKQAEQSAAKTVASLRAVHLARNFDVEFVRRMIPHHSAGIVEFLEPQARAVHAQLRVAAATGITAQEAEAADFRTWLAGMTHY